MGDTVDAIQSYARLSEQQKERAETLAHLLREQTTFLQAVTSPEDITPEWVAKRDALAMLACNFIDDNEDESSQISSSHLR